MTTDSFRDDGERGNNPSLERRRHKIWVGDDFSPEVTTARSRDTVDVVVRFDNIASADLRTGRWLIVIFFVSEE